MTTRNLSHEIRKAIKANGPMNTGALAEHLGLTDSKPQVSKALSTMVAAKILVADKGSWPPKYEIGREASDRKEHAPEVYADRKRERHRLLMRKYYAADRAAKPPKPPKPIKPVAPKPLKLASKPVVQKPVVVAETVEQWMARTGQKPDVLPSFLSKDYDETVSTGG